MIAWQEYWVQSRLIWLNESLFLYILEEGGGQVNCKVLFVVYS